MNEEEKTPASAPDATPAAEPRKPRPRWLRRLLLFVLVCVSLLGGLLTWLDSDSFREHLRQRLVASIAAATGARVELKSIEWSLWRREILIDGLTLHGREAANEEPLAHVDRVRLRLTLIGSWLGRRAHLREVTLTRPIFHYIAYPDHSTNIPTPTTPPAGDGLARLFDLAIDHVELNRGWFLWNQKRWPLELNADRILAELNYAPASGDYRGRVGAARMPLSIMTLQTFNVSLDANIGLQRDQLRIDEARIAFGRSRLRAVGRLSLASDPRLELSYQSFGELADIAAIGRMTTLRGGAYSVDGAGFLTGDDYAAKGRLAFTRGDYVDDGFALRDASGSADYSLDPKGATIANLSADVLGGKAVGGGRLPWDARGDHQAGDLNLKLRGLSAGAVLSALSTRELPLMLLRVDANVDGEMNVHWSGPIAAADARFALQLSPLADASHTPLTGSLEAVHHGAGELWSFSRFEFYTPSSMISASGNIGRRAADLRLAARTTRFAELAPLLLRDASKSPLDLRGSASFAGDVQGSLRAPELRGHVELRDFATLTARRLPDGAVAPEPLRLHWDELAGEVFYTPSQLRIDSAQLRHAAATIGFSAALELRNGAIADDARLHAQLAMRQVNLAELDAIAGRSDDVDGRLDARLMLDGPLNHLQGAGEASVGKASLMRIPFASLRANLSFHDDAFELRRIVAESAGGDIRGEIAADLGAATLRLDLQADHLRLASLGLPLGEQLRPDGELDFRLSAHGPWRRPEMELTANAVHCELNKQRIGELKLTATAANGRLKAAVRTASKYGSFSLDGEASLDGDRQSHWTAALRADDLNPLLSSLAPVRLTGPTVVAMRADIAGPLLHPDQMSGSILFDELRTELEKIPLGAQGGVRLTLARGQLNVERLRIAGAGGRYFELEGSAGLTGRRELRLRASGDADFRLLQTFYPQLSTGGGANFDVRIRGSLDRPRLDGRLQIANGSISLGDMPNGLSEINGRLNFNQDRLQVQELRARTGGGMVDLGGFITYGRGLGLALTAQGRDIRIRYPQGVSSTANARLTLTGGLQDMTLAGEVTVTRFGLNSQLDVSSYLAAAHEAPALSPADSALGKIHLDVRILTAPELQVQTTQARIAGSADLRLRGSAAHPSLLGRVNISEGEINFNGAKYRLERGDVSFTDAVRIQAVLNVQLSATVRGYDITLGLNGPLDKMRPTYHSDPPLPEGDIIALLALGRTREQANMQHTIVGSQQQTMTLTDSTSSQLLAEALNATVSNRAQRLFGVSRIKIDPHAGGVETNSGARVTIEQQVANKATLTYITNVSQSSQQVIEFEYNINRDVSLVAVRDQNGVIGVELRIRQRRK